MKKIPIKQIKINPKKITKELPFWLVVLAVYAFTVIMSYQTYELFDAFQTQRGTNAELKNQLTLIQSSKKLDKTEIERFNTVAGTLVPAQENYFDLIQALERLSLRTGFQLYNYSINLTGTTSEKLSLSVAGRGDNDSFFRFLQEYQYASGRLITIESINYTPKSVQEYTFVLNFYHKELNIEQKTPQISSSLPALALVNDIIGSSVQLTDDDVNFVRLVLDEAEEMNSQ